MLPVATYALAKCTMNSMNACAHTGMEPEPMGVVVSTVCVIIWMRITGRAVAISNTIVRYTTAWGVSVIPFHTAAITLVIAVSTRVGTHCEQVPKKKPEIQPEY